MDFRRKKWLILFPFFLAGTPGAGAEGLLPRVHFLRDSHELLGEARGIIAANARWLAQNPSAVLILEGHCDEWGEEPYNEELGDRRAREVKSGLIESGTDPERIIMVVSFGETHPLDPAHTREAWNKNRRVEFVLR